MLPQADEQSTLLGGQGVSLLSLAYLRGALWENTKMIYASHRAKTVILARSFFNPLKFSRPANQAEALTRVRANWATYKLFYGVVYGLVLVYTILSSPILLLGLFSIGSSWAYLFVLHDAHAVVKVGDYELGRREKLLVLVPGSIVIIAITGAAARARERAALPPSLSGARAPPCARLTRRRERARPSSARGDRRALVAGVGALLRLDALDSARGAAREGGARRARPARARGREPRRAIQLSSRVTARRLEPLASRRRRAHAGSQLDRTGGL
jgi:hypothetical protein